MLPLFVGKYYKRPKCTSFNGIWTGWQSQSSPLQDTDFAVQNPILLGGKAP